MKNLNEIIEGLKVSSKSKISKDNVTTEVYILPKTRFKENEINDIKRLCDNLPIVPNKITNCFYLEKNKRKGKSYNSGVINLYYFYEHTGRITIIKDYETNKFHIRCISTKSMIDTLEFPNDLRNYFTTINECFDCIIKNWDNIKKYISNE